MHAHFGDPLVIDSSYFQRLSSGKIGVAVEEGYRIFDLDNPTKVVDVSGIELGQAQVCSTIQTKISFITKQEQRLIKSAGLKSKEEANRLLEMRYSKKVKWVTFVRFMPLVKLVNRGANTQERSER